MNKPERLWEATVDEVKNGFIEEKGHYQCLLCNEQIEKGIIYPHEEVFYEAERYMRLHIEVAHGSVFHYLMGMDKKLTGLTEHQNRLLGFFYEGKKDAEIQQEMEIGSASTIRNHRFVLKEKERQAKLFLAMMELLKEKDEYAPAFIEIHQTATMVDDRYNVTAEEEQAILAKFFEKEKLKSFPPKEKQRLVAIKEISKQFTAGERYSEPQVNGIIEPIFSDYGLVRRYLVEYGFLGRTRDGSEYWLEK
ncbi:DUF2087 domain-containing protein [Planococcus ruber]|uniref:DUF2087 domain-containing protein n=1 Tax=Planococcus ruber TaxID=2027871 RepID=UPI001FEFC498|nr:DUF2087 domain-containing protein [Planococcus ruber]MCJ1909514.1 DUF2087 domain-containing protein [Planococcus ruber]